MGYRLTLKQIAFVFELFYGGIPLRRASTIFRDMYELPISPSTILRRIIYWGKVADEATTFLIKNRKLGFDLHVGDVWEIDEIYLKVRDKRDPLIAVRDLRTSFFVGGNFADSVTSKAVKVALALARDLTHKCPRELRCDGHAAYNRAVRTVFRGETKLTVHKRDGRKGQNQSIEGTFSVLRSRLRRMKSLHSFETSFAIVKGLVLDHNFVRSSVVLGNRTPAELALRWKPLDGKGGWLFLLGLADYYKKRVLNPSRQEKSPNADQPTLDTFLTDDILFTGLRPAKAE